jgi:hypothetical protein
MGNCLRKFHCQSENDNDRGWAHKPGLSRTASGDCQIDRPRIEIDFLIQDVIGNRSDSIKKSHPFSPWCFAFWPSALRPHARSSGPHVRRLVSEQILGLLCQIVTNMLKSGFRIFVIALPPRIFYYPRYLTRSLCFIREVVTKVKRAGGWPTFQWFIRLELLSENSSRGIREGSHRRTRVRMLLY